MRSRFCLLWLFVAVAACDRVTSPSHLDGGPDSAAALWEQVDAGTVNYNAVAGSAPDNVFIVGDQGTILHWDGIALVPEASGTAANLRGLAVVDPTLTYAVGEQGTVLCRQEGAWTVLPSLTSAVLNAVWASADNAIAVGEQGTIVHLHQSVWELVVTPRADNYYSIVKTPNETVIVGALGLMTYLDQATGESRTGSIPGYTKVIAGAVSYRSEAYFVGADGGFFNYAWGKLTRITGLPQKFLRAVSFADDTAWVVGHEGLVATGAVNTTPTLVPTPDDRWLLGVYAAAPTDVWVVGRSGLIMRGPPGARGLTDGGPP
jgi:hypothetical protein